MLLEKKDFSNKEPDGEWNLIITDGGMGDLIGCLVAVDYNIKHFTKVKFHTWVPDYLFWFAKHVLPRGSSIKPFSNSDKDFKKDIFGLTSEWITPHTCMRTHPVDYGFHMLSDRHIYDLNEKNYLQIKPDFIDISKFDIPRDYIVMAATGTEPVRTMPVETANALIDYFLDKGLKTVFLGKEKSDCGFKDFYVTSKPIPINTDKGINLMNQTNLLEGAKIIHQSKAFIGMDGGLLHLAGCTDAHILCGFTASSPDHVAPIRNGSQSYKFKAIEPDKDIPNRYFQTNGSFLKGNFQKFEGWEALQSSMTTDKFIKAFESIT